MRRDLSGVAGVVPAKSSSQRVPGKNCRELLGVPLFLCAAANLARVIPPERVFIDTDSREMGELARAAGFGFIHRPAELADNATDGNGLMAWEFSAIDADVLVQHLPPMAFCRRATLERGLEAVIGGAEGRASRADSAKSTDSPAPPRLADSARSVELRESVAPGDEECPANPVGTEHSTGSAHPADREESPAWADSAVAVYRQSVYRWDPEWLEPLYDLTRIPNSFTLPEQLVEGMGLYVTPRGTFEACGTRVGRRPALLELDPFERIDIDHPEDLELARAAARGLPADSDLVSAVHELAARLSAIEVAR